MKEINKQDIEKSNSWPIVEAKKILKERKSFIEKKGKIVLPDPFQKFSSFGEHNNEMLKKFLDQFNFKYNFLSSTKLYKSGFFNEPLKKILENYDGIMNIIIPTLGKERQKTYSPFLPICPKTGQVLEIPVLEIDKSKSCITFDNKGEKINVSILDGKCKLQWKVDWAMRW